MQDNSYTQKFHGWLSSKLDKYRTPSTSHPATPAVDTPADTPTDQPALTIPQTEEELIEILKRCPKSALSNHERSIIAAVMGFATTPVSQIMLPASEITFVFQDEILGPLTLDKLYKSGFSHFPVVDQQHQVIGALHTEALNSLEIRETDCAKKYLDPHVYYIRADYALEQALAAFMRNDCYFLLVVDRSAQLVGLLTWEMVIRYLFGGVDLTDDFDKDSDKLAVARR